MNTLLVQQATAAGVQTITLPYACRLLGYCSDALAFISSDPNIATTEVSAPAASGTRNTVFAITSASALLSIFPIAPEFSAGETLCLIFSAKGNVLLYLDPI